MVAATKSKGIVCYLCKKPGHKKSQCFRNKSKKQEKQFGGSANQATDTGESTMCAFVNGEFETKIGDRWHLSQTRNS